VRLLLALVLLLAGCGGGGENAADSDNHGYGWEYDIAGQGGMRLRKNGATAQDVQMLELTLMSVARCAGVETPPGPFVIVIPNGGLDPVPGFYFSNPPLILLDEAFADHTMWHESVHYVLDYTTGDLDAEHRSTLFATCGAS
jgi:hypothetical protein